ncbi:MAG: hypothetical protein ACRD0K_30500 [Egibacteraceae bacterium]
MRILRAASHEEARHLEAMQVALRLSEGHSLYNQQLVTKVTKPKTRRGQRSENKKLTYQGLMSEYTAPRPLRPDEALEMSRGEG